MNKLFTFLVFVALVMSLTNEKADAHPSLVEIEGEPEPQTSCCCCGAAIVCGIGDDTSSLNRTIHLPNALSNIQMTPQSQMQGIPETMETCCCCGYCLSC